MDGKTPLLFLHGFPMDSRMWRHTVDHFSMAHPTVAPNAVDLVGDGASMAAMASWAINALDASQPGASAIVIGLSMGGYIAAELVANYPKRVRGLVLCDTRAGAETAEGKAGRDAMIKAVREHGVVPGTAPLVAKLLHDPPRALATEVARMVEDQSVEAIIACVEAMRDRRDHTATIRSLDVPMLVISGEYDVLAPVEVEQALASLNPRGRYVQIADAGHVPPLEKPEAFNAALSEFLDSIDA